MDDFALLSVKAASLRFPWSPRGVSQPVAPKPIVPAPVQPPVPPEPPAPVPPPKGGGLAGSPEGYLLGAGAAGGVGATALLGAKDVSAVHDKLQAWDRGMEGWRSRIATGTPLNLQEAEGAINSYVAGGRPVAQSTILGMNVGRGVGTSREIMERPGTLPARLRLALSSRSILGWRPFQTRQMHDYFDTEHANRVRDHYRMYADPKASPESLRDHHLHKALDTSHSSEWRNPTIFNERAKAIIDDPKLNFTQKHQALLKENPTAAKIFEESLLGNGRQAGEAARLAGNPKIGLRSTPGAYMGVAGRELPALARGMRGTGKGALGLAGILAVASQFAEKKSDDDPYAPVRFGAGTAATVGGGYNAYAGLKGVFNPQRRIGVTYGEMPAIGDGHKTPGKAIAQSMRDDPRFSKFQIDELPRNQHGVFDPIPAGRRYALGIDTGLGAYGGSGFDPGMKEHGMAPSTRFRPERHMAYLTDMAPKEHHLLAEHMGAPVGEAPSKLNRKGLNVLFYGDNAETWKDLRPQDKIHQIGKGVTPGLDPRTVELLRNQPHNRQQVLENIIGQVEKQVAANPKDTYLAQQLAELKSITPEHKIVTIAGAGRGDYTAIRARELAEKLRANPELAAKVKILAFQAGGFGGPTEELLKDVKGVASLGKIMPTVAGGKFSIHPYAQMQGLSDVNWGATGTSGLHEQLLNRNVQAVPKDWGFSAGNYEKYEGTPGTIAGRQDAAIKAKGGTFSPHAAIDTWNAGNKQHALKQPGVVRADTADDIINLLRDEGRLKTLSTDAQRRAMEQLGHYDAAQSGMRDVLLREANAGVRRMQLRAGARAGAGGLAMAAGIPLAASAFSSSAPPPPQRTFRDMVKAHQQGPTPAPAPVPQPAPVPKVQLPPPAQRKLGEQIEKIMQRLKLLGRNVGEKVGVDEFLLMAVKAAMIDPVPVPTPAPHYDPMSGIGARPGETGLGVPRGGLPTGPLTPEDMAKLSTPEAEAASRYAGKPSAPVVGSSGRGLRQMMGGRGGRAGLALLAAGGLGAGLYALTRKSDTPAPAPVPQPQGQVPGQPRAEKGTARDVNRRRVLGTLKDTAGTFWSRMRQRYSTRPQQMEMPQ